jgi:protein TonB
VFEDSLIESGNRIKARSKYWSLVTFFLNTGIVITAVIWPLLHPAALPTQLMAPLMVAPPPSQSPTQAPQAPRVQVRSETLANELQTPSHIPRVIKLSTGIPPEIENVSGIEDPSRGISNGIGNILEGIGTGPAVTVKQANPKPLPISSGVMAGNLLEKKDPQYPAIAKAAHIQGIVVLQATISTTGLIENVRVLSGQPMLQQAAIDSVRTWRYKPYLLNGAHVEVETTISVIFNLN